jgi:glucose-1-phosphate thymidylyltransferase
MIHTAIIAAAGKGMRMREMSDIYPKPLTPVCGQPFLHYVLESVRAIGCTKIILVAGHRFAQMYDYIQQLPYPVEVINQSDVVGEDYGTAAVVRAAADRIGDESFVLYNGDMLYSQSVMELLQDDGYTHLLAATVKDPRPFGVVEVDAEGFMKEIVEKPAEPKSSLINLGLYLCQPEVIQAAMGVEKSPRGELEFVDALNALAAQRRVKVDTVSGEWITLTQPEDIPEIEHFLATHKRV